LYARRGKGLEKEKKVPTAVLDVSETGRTLEEMFQMQNGAILFDRVPGTRLEKT
jgi:hypothetical protein